MMDGELQKPNAWSRIFIGAATEVHRLKGRAGSSSLGVMSKRRVAQLSSTQKTTKDTKHFVPEGLDERSLAVYCLETVRKSVPSR